MKETHNQIYYPKMNKNWEKTFENKTIEKC